MNENKIFINLTNHPSGMWSEEQLSAASEYGQIVDLSFPTVEADANEDTITSIAKEFLDKILAMANGANCTVHVMGEMTLTYALVSMLKAAGINCVASTSIRDVKLLPDGTKQVAFHFCRFRKY